MSNWARGGTREILRTWDDVTVSEQDGGGGYNRTASGLVASLVVTVLAVVAFVAFRGVFSKDLQVEPANVDYLGTVADLQAAEFMAVYPPALPDGWRGTSVDFEPGERPALSLSFLTDDGDFVGVRQEDAAADDLLQKYVDPNVAEADPLTVTGSVAPVWAGWSDDGGDLAYTAEVGEQTVMVFGSASDADLRLVVGSLTADPVATPSPTG